MTTEKNQNEAASRNAVAWSDELDETWKKEALKSYFRDRPGLYADTVDVMGYFKISSILEASEALIKDGWLGRTNAAFPKMYQIGV